MVERQMRVLGIALVAVVVLAGCGASDEVEEPTATRMAAEGAPTLAPMAPPPGTPVDESKGGAGTASPMASPATGGGEPATGSVTLEGYDIGWRYDDQDTAAGEITITVAPGTVIELVNEGSAAHNFEAADLGLDQDMPVGETVQVTIPEDAEPGEYAFICNIPGHAQAGMVGVLVIAEEGAAAGGDEAATGEGDAAGGAVTLEGYDIGWRYSGQDVNGGEVTMTVAPGTVIELVNSGNAMHNFEAADLGLNEDMPAGQTVQVTIPEDAEPGEYAFICNIPGHAPAGMVGTLVVH
ncbi:MAG: cupredoxin domain-containing protein [Chloroflexia bacterium]|nr:cupredoxin domain-containing protein [Chloroflexia bacterium]